MLRTHLCHLLHVILIEHKEPTPVQFTSRSFRLNRVSYYLILSRTQTF